MKRALSPQRRISLPRKTADRKATAASPDDDGADAAAAGAIVAIAKASRGPQGRITGLRLQSRRLSRRKTLSNLN
jgi:hypothetical protein